MTCAGGPSVYKDGGRTASTELSPPCCLQRPAYTTATNLSDDFRHGMWNIGLVSPQRALPGPGKGQVSLLLWLCSGGWRENPCPCAAAAFVPSPGNKVWSMGLSFSTRRVSCSCFALELGPSPLITSAQTPLSSRTASRTTFPNFMFISAVLYSIPTTDT